MKNACFQFYKADVTVFSNTFISLALPLSNPSQPKTIFNSKPHHIQANLCKINLKGMFLTFFSSFPLRLCRNFLRVLKLGIFSKMGWGSWFCEIFFKILIRLSPIWFVCICVGPLWHFKLVLRHFYICSCIFHWWFVVLHALCLTKCSSDIFVLDWTQLSSIAWVYS